MWLYGWENVVVNMFVWLWVALLELGLPPSLLCWWRVGGVLLSNNQRTAGLTLFPLRSRTRSTATWLLTTGQQCSTFSTRPDKRYTFFVCFVHPFCRPCIARTTAPKSPSDSNRCCLLPLNLCLVEQDFYVLRRQWIEDRDGFILVYSIVRFFENFFC